MDIGQSATLKRGGDPVNIGNSAFLENWVKANKSGGEYDVGFKEDRLQIPAENTDSVTARLEGPSPPGTGGRTARYVHLSNRCIRFHFPSGPFPFMLQMDTNQKWQPKKANPCGKHRLRHGSPRRLESAWDRRTYGAVRPSVQPLHPFSFSISGPFPFTLQMDTNQKWQPKK